MGVHHAFSVKQRNVFPLCEILSAHPNSTQPAGGTWWSFTGACKWIAADLAFESETAVSKEEKQREANKSAGLLCVSEGCKQWKCNYNMGWNLTHLMWSVLSRGQVNESKGVTSPLSFPPLLMVKRSWAKPKPLVRIQKMIWFIPGSASCQSWFLKCNEDHILSCPF